MASFNKVILIGHLTADPELKQTQSGVSVTSFSIGVNRRFKRENGQQDCDFITVVAWRNTAEFITRYFRKGQPILVCGQLQTRNWTDNQGNKRNAVEVVADEATFVAPQENTANSAPVNPYNPYNRNEYQQERFEEIPSDESLPF